MRLPPETVAKIYEAHGRGMLILQAAAYAGVNKTTIEKYWHGAGLSPPNPRRSTGRPRLGPDACPGYVTAYEAARRLGITRMGVSYLVEHGRLGGYRTHSHHWIREADVAREREARAEQT